MYFKECESLVREHPGTKSVVEFLDIYIAQQGIGAFLVPELVAGYATEQDLRTEQVEQVLSLLADQGLLHIEEVVQCQNCDTYTLFAEVEEAINENEALECSDCGANILEHDYTRQICYRTARGAHSLQINGDELTNPQPAGSLTSPANNQTVRILHLSDLHFSKSTNVDNELLPLLADLRTVGDQVDAVIITGDFTNCALPEEFTIAFSFISRLLQELKLSHSACAIVPGNHDAYWDCSVYHPTMTKPLDLADERYKISGDVILERDDEKYPNRFTYFSTHLYEPLFGNPYPREFADQYVVIDIPNTKVQVLAMNSVWRIDNYYPNRASIHDTALLRGIQAINGSATHSPLLRIAIFHDPATGNDKMPSETYLEHLSQAGFRLCLHGDIHEERNDIVNPIEPRKSIWAVGVGAFGASASARPPSTPRIYNILEINADGTGIRVHSRSCPRDGGAWGPYCIWPSEDGNTSVRQAYYDLSFLASAPVNPAPS